MAQVAHQPDPMTLDDFLAWESRQEGRYELVDGHALAMGGGTAGHNLVVQNIAGAELYSRDADGLWRYALMEGLGQSVDLTAPGLSLTLAETFRDALPTPSGETPPTPAERAADGPRHR